MIPELDYLMEWSRMSLRPKKSRSLFIKKGKMSPLKYPIKICYTGQEPVKSLEKCFALSLKYTKLRHEGKFSGSAREKQGKAIVVTSEGGTKTWCRRAASMRTEVSLSYPRQVLFDK
ncbi:hypothetical protein PoB_007188200 [Plakobranchus ocellatus]|uniref:Uncharacterized protein n=1 Tax=Plakobranchus ocellatus TaxID=259542 RepID=A0AAV4DM45_9GAST|nr:hypothetical protein PoB_007188200 [Plakobranchus ocellatus]